MQTNWYTVALAVLGVLTLLVSNIFFGYIIFISGQVHKHCMYTISVLLHVKISRVSLQIKRDEKNERKWAQIQ